MSASLARSGLGGLAILGALCAASGSRAGFGTPRVDVRDVAGGTAAAQSPSDASGQAPAKRYARLDRARCEAELARRGIPFAHVDDARGILAPVRLS